MQHVLTVLLPIILIGCSGTIGEPERKMRVQALIKQLADESLENRQVAFAELQDTFVRKRDIPELKKEFDRNDDPEVRSSLELLLILLGEDCWRRLPDKGWTTDINECIRRWKGEFQDLGCQARMIMDQSSNLYLAVLVSPEKWPGVSNRILTLEPDLLTLRGSVTDITSLGTLANLKGLSLEHAGVTDLTPLKGLPRLGYLCLENTKVTDLTPLKGLQNLEILRLSETQVTDLTPLKGLPNLGILEFENTKETDLTPLKGLQNLRQLELRNPGVTDLTPLKGMPDLEIWEKAGPDLWRGKKP